MKKEIPIFFIFCFLQLSCHRSEKSTQQIEPLNATIKEAIVLTAKEKTTLEELLSEDALRIDLNANDLASQLLKIQEQYKKANTLYLDHPELGDTIRPIFWKLCPLYDLLKQKKGIIDEFKFDSISTVLWGNTKKTSENMEFLKALLAQRKESSLISIEKAIAPVFKIKNDSVGIYNMAYMASSSKADSLLFEQTPFNSTQRPAFWSGNGNFLYKEPLDSLYPSPKKLFLYSTSSKYASTVQSFGKYIDECLEYYYYDIKMTPHMQREKEFLFASPYDLQLTYVNNARIDSLLRQNNPNICVDCPDSYGYLRTFATLDNIDDIYFVYAAEPNKAFDETDTPIRAVFYCKDELVYALWTADIDLFGCMCL